MTQHAGNKIPAGPGLPRLAADIGLATVFALAALLYVNLAGPNYTFDSNQYLIAAEQMGQGNFDRLNEYAPLFPWALGLLNWVLGDMLLAINISLLLGWFLLFLVLRLALRPGPVALAFVFVFLFSNAASAAQFGYVLTELGYAVLMLIAVVALGGPALFAGDPGNWVWRHRNALFLVAIALLPLQRYVGGFMTVYLALVYLLMSPGLRDLQRRLIQLTGAAVPFAFVLFWNFLSTGHFGGFRRVVQHGFSENVELLNALLFGQFGFETAVLAGVSVGLIGWSLAGRRAAGWRLTSGLILVLLVPFVQFAIQVFAASEFYADTMNARFVIVILPLIAAFAIKAVALAMQALPRALPGLDRYFLREAVFLLVVIGLAGARSWPAPLYDMSVHDAPTRPKLTQAVARPGLNTVALAQDDFLGWFAADVLTGQLTYDLPCRAYTVDGPVSLPGFRFVPECAGVSAPVLAPIVFQSWSSTIEGADALLLRYFEDDASAAAAIVASAPVCTTPEVLTDGGYRRYVFFDLRACGN